MNIVNVSKYNRYLVGRIKTRRRLIYPIGYFLPLWFAIIANKDNCKYVDAFAQVPNFSHNLNFESTFVSYRNMNTLASTRMDRPDTSSEFQLFGKFKIESSQIFYTSPSKMSKAFVNLRPIVPGHVLVISTRVVQRMDMLSDEEYHDLWQTVRVVQKLVETVHKSTDSNVAVQDGRGAGQSVPHVHVHILPRIAGDFERNDDVYDELQDWAPKDDMRQKQNLDVPNDDQRKDRTAQEMEEEASCYRKALEGSDII